MKNNSHTLTKGSVGKGILLFALPLLGSSLIQQLYSTVDLIFVGQLLGTKASAAIGASGLIVTCLISTVVVMGVTGKVTEFMVKLLKKNETNAGEETRA